MSFKVSKLVRLSHHVLQFGRLIAFISLRLPSPTVLNFKGTHFPGGYCQAHAYNDTDSQ